MINMLGMAKKHKARILQASTSEVYGDPLEHPQKETYFGNVDPLGQRACYDEGKRAAETLCKDFYIKYKTEVRIVRIFNVYGPRMMFNDGRVISNFFLQSCLNEDITIHGDGSQTRSFCYIDDFLNALVAWMETDADYLPVNIGNPEEISILNLAREIKELVKSKSKIVFMPYQEVAGRLGDVKQRQADIGKIKNLLNWQPTISLAEGLKKVDADFKQRLEHKPHLLVFSPSFAPFTGPAEIAVEEIIKRLPGWEFDVLTSRFNKKLSKESHQGTVNIYRLGHGSKLDKFFLPWRAYCLAVKLHRKYHYQLAWAIMASYGALAAAWFNFFHKKVPFLLSVYEGDFSEKSYKKTLPFKWLFRLIFKKASRWQLIAKLSQLQQAWLEDDKSVQIVNFKDGPDLLAKRTKEIFQELEILSNRK